MANTNVSSKTPLTRNDLLDALHEINADKFQEYFEIDTECINSVNIYTPGADMELIGFVLTSPKKVSIDERPEEEWAAWVFQVILNELALKWNGRITGKHRHEANEGKFSDFLTFLLVMTEVHTIDHFNWLETQIPSEFMEVILPDGIGLVQQLEEHQEKEAELLEA